MDEELERQYSPSRWSKRFDAEEVQKNHLDFVTKASDEARRDVPYRAVRYGEGEKQVFDLYGTSLPEDAPLFVYIHGGYWQEMDRTISSYVVKPLYQNGIRVAVVGYDLAPKVSLRKITEEIEDLGTFISELAEKNKTKSVWYAGHSAGAHLAAILLKQKKDYIYNGIVFISGIYDLTPLLKTYVNDVLKLTSDEAIDLSVNNLMIKEQSKPQSYLVVVPENESPEFQRQSKEFHEMLIKNGLKSEFMFLDILDHFDVAEKLSENNYVLTLKIIEFLKG